MLIIFLLTRFSFSTDTTSNLPQSEAYFVTTEPPIVSTHHDFPNFTESVETPYQSSFQLSSYSNDEKQTSEIQEQTKGDDESPNLTVGPIAPTNESLPETPAQQPTDEGPGPQTSDIIIISGKPTDMPPEISTDMLTEMPTDASADLPTEDIHDNHRKFYVCEGGSCQDCHDELDDDEIEVGFEKLNGLLGKNVIEDIEIRVCGSTRENHPIIDASNLFDKNFDIKGKIKPSFLEISNPQSKEGWIDFLDAEDITLIVQGKLFISTTELENSPIECESITFSDVESDLISLSFTKQANVKSQAIIGDKVITSLVIGADKVIFSNSNDNKATMYLEESESNQISFELEVRTLDFSIIPGTKNIIQSLMISLLDKNHQDVTLNFDKTWDNQIENINQFIIGFGDFDLYINSENKAIADQIRALGQGNVIRNGKTDTPEPTIPISPTNNDPDDSDGETSDSGLTAGVLICLIILGGVIIILGYILYKKCKSRKLQKYSGYLNNTQDLEPIQPIESI
ncbi:hypothetical protein TRFO_10466 [Tritrichomonas foetus]|uniref:Uncharacterized protein n=1 Tax=Tritrichomonas foetus TaxID=1144522 RepID=A0A1J4JBF3_9EUKA|nr:hypothetical protein TRFO_10466 [Tritrichomonas foetus]|eukprot:OHS95567.1 hypothetical protein TRFO_10466 [Tritrichomonas foetus]